MLQPGQIQTPNTPPVQTPTLKPNRLTPEAPTPTPQTALPPLAGAPPVPGASAPDGPQATAAPPTPSAATPPPIAGMGLPASTPPLPSGQLNTAGIGPQATTTTANWQTANATEAGRQQAIEAAHAAAGQADTQNGYNIHETQDQLNARRGLTLNPSNGSYDDPNTRSASLPMTWNNAANRYDVTNPTPVGGGTPTLPLASAPSAPDGPQAAAGLPLASSATSGPGGVNLSNQNLTGQTIGVGQTPDRAGLASSMFDTFQRQSDPAYQASIREAESNGAALGQIGSGGLRTSVGNLANARGQQLDTAREGFLNNALEGSIGDQYRSVGVAQQQQGFQEGQQNTAFSQGLQQTALQEALTSGDFSRYMQLLNAGNTGNPSDTALTLANSYGNQAGAAGAAAGNLISGSVANQNSGLSPAQQELLRQQGGSPRVPTGTQVDSPRTGPVPGDG